MWDSLVTSGIAVVGTLAGGLLANVAQQRGARTERREHRQEARRADALAAVTGLADALARHRTNMWMFERGKLTGADTARVAELENSQHITRRAITVPLTTVAILAPALADQAREAAFATYAMRESADLDVLEARRALALAAADRFVAAAAEFFADLGLVVA